VRSQGTEFTWTSNAPVLLILASVDTESTAMSIATCRPRDGETHFRVPAEVLRNFPANSGETPLGGAAVITLPDPQRFQAAGLDAGLAMMLRMEGQSVAFE
jgi:hypothetical protein